MSVLIRGVKMPSRCAECILCDLRYGTKCKVTGETYYDGKGYARGGYDGKPDWCPLVELPETHESQFEADANGKVKIIVDGYKVAAEKWNRRGV